MSLFQRLAFRYIQAITERPIRTRLTTACVLTTSANVISQTVIEGTSPAKLDWQRLRKVLFASLILSVIRHYQFKLINTLIPPATAGPFQIFQQLLLDQVIFAPITNGLFFVLMALQNNQEISPEDLEKKLWPTMKMYWRIWPAAKLFSFQFVPVPFRPLFGDFIGFFWAIFLSTMTKRRSAIQSQRR